MPGYGNILSFGIIDKVTIPMKIAEVKPGKNGFNLTLRDYNPAMYEYGEIPEYKTNLTTPPQAGEKVPTLTEAQISDIATGAAGGVVQKGETSDTPAIIVTAEKEGIRLQVLPLSATAKNVIQYATWEINKGTGWESVEGTDLQAFYAFDRKFDGYPEASGLSSWRVRCQVVNLWGKASAYGGTEAGQAINTDNYGTWELQPPVVVVSTSNRSVNLKLTQPDRADNRILYGTIRHRIQIKRPDIDSQFYKPAEGLNPLESEQNYKDGSGHVTSTISYTQTLPLQGQNDDPPAPTATLYQYQVTAENEAGLSNPTVVNATALATSVYDIVKGWYKNEQGEKVKIDGALGAESIYTESLAAISANMGDITAGSISSVPEAGETKPNVLLDLDNEEFRIGNNPSLEDSGSEDAEYIHYTKGKGLVMKIKNFVVTALASIISGVFRVKAKGTADSESFFIVNPESTTDSTTGTPGNTVKIMGALESEDGILNNITVTGGATVRGRISTNNIVVTSYATVNGLINGTRIKSHFEMGAVSINNRKEHLLTGNNIDIGADALKSVQGGASENIAIGRYAGYGITTSINNIAIGFNAGRSITTGSNNIAIGADIPVSALSKQVAIGDIRQVRFPATTTGIIVWEYFQLIFPFGGTLTCFVSAASLHGYKLFKDNGKQLITIYNTKDIEVKIIGNNQTTLGQEIIILCNREYFP